MRPIFTKFGKFAQLVGGFSCLQANDDRLVVVEPQIAKQTHQVVMLELILAVEEVVEAITT